MVPLALPESIGRDPARRRSEAKEQWPQQEKSRPQKEAASGQEWQLETEFAAKAKEA